MTRSYLLILGIAILALGMRIWYLSATEANTPWEGDAASYLTYANNLVRYGTFSKDLSAESLTPDSYWAPGFPALLAVLLWTVGPQDVYDVLCLIHAFVGAVLAGATTAVGLLLLPRAAAGVAGILVAINPHLIAIGANALTETTFSAALLVSFGLYFLALRKDRRYLFALSGFAFGAAYLLNPVMLFVPAIAIVLSMLQRRVSIASLAVTLLCFLSVAGSWHLRNTISVPSHVQSSADRALDNFVQGMHPSYHERLRNNRADPHNPAHTDSVAVNGSWFRAGQLFWHRFTESPAQYAHWYLLEKPWLFWSWNILIGQGDIYVYAVKTALFQTSKPAIAIYTIAKALHWWTIAFAGLGCLFVLHGLLRNDADPVASILVLGTLCIMSVYVCLQSEPRYSIPLRPEMFLISMFGVVRLLHVLRRFKRPVDQ